MERQIAGEMTPKQAKVYHAYLMKSQKTFAAELGDMNSGDNRIRILAILTRLRQIACDPSLFIENYDGARANWIFSRSSWPTLWLAAIAC